MVLQVWIGGSVIVILFIPFMQEIGMEGADMVSWIILWPIMLAARILIGAVNIVAKALEK